MSLIAPMGEKCWYCGELAATTSDHQVPKSRKKGLRHNRVPACKPCNNFKGARTVEEFRDYLKAWDKLKPNTTKHSVVAIRARGWVFYGEAKKKPSL